MAVSIKFQNRFIELVAESEIKKKTEIAQNIGIVYSIFCKIYNYGILPTVPILIRIADYFNISVEYLLGNADNDYFCESEFPKTFSERIEELRIKEGIPTTCKLAEKIHFHRNCIAKWKINEYIPAISDIENIADYFNVSIDYLLGRTDDPSPYKNSLSFYCNTVSYKC